MKNSVQVSIFFILFALALSCSKKDNPSPAITVAFSSTNVTAINAGKEYVPIEITLGSVLPSNGTIDITVTAGSGLTVGNGQMIEISPAPVNNIITLSGSKDKLKFFVTSNISSSLTADNSITFEITKTPAGYSPGSSKSITVNVTNNTLSSGLVGEYLFNSGAFDTSGKSHNGIIHGATLDSSRTGKPNASYSFNGTSSYISIADNADMNFASDKEFSVSLWTLPNSTQNEVLGDILRKWVGDTQGYPFAIAYLGSASSTNPNQFDLARFDGNACGHGPTIFSSAVTSTYHHVVMIKSGSSISLYVDNILSATVPDTTTTSSTCGTTNTSDITIGCRGQLVRYFNGHIDDIRFYNRAITKAEINLLYSL